VVKCPAKTEAKSLVRTSVSIALTALLFLVVLVPLLGFMGKWLTPDEINLYYGFVSAPVFSVYSSITTYYFVTAED